MKKNKMMRTASGLLVATLLTTSIISGTFAKYVTTASGEDSARVAKWGFNDDASIELTDLFKDVYTNDNNNETVKSTTDVIAPGTKGEANFKFTYGGDGKATAPEVAYTFKVDTTGSECDDSIKNNKNIVWKLDEGQWGTWDQLITAINALDGNVEADTAKNTPADYYAPNTLPTAFDVTKTHKVSWEWKFEGTDTYDTDKSQDQYDTDMGNKTNLDKVTLKISVTATQID